MDKNLAKIDGETKLIGLLATPIGHTLSPQMHNIAFTKLQLNYAYLAFEAGNMQLEDAINGFRALNIRGWNVSMPNKTKILPYLDELDDSARFTGAVNTVVNENGKLKGYSTDGMGYVRNLKERGIELKGKKMTLVGSGGAATPIAIEAVRAGLREISIFARDDAFFKNAEQNVAFINHELAYTGIKANLFALEDKQKLAAEIAESDIFANGTGVGMKPLEGKSVLEDSSVLRSDLIVTDVVYIPFKTKLLEQAEAAGATAINGLGMMLWQGALAFELWTGHQMPVEEVSIEMFGRGAAE